VPSLIPVTGVTRRLPSWLRAHEPELYASLYGGQPADTAVDDLQAAAAALGLTDVDEHAARIRFGLRQDPAQAIGSAKELLESVLKAILGLHGNGPETRLEIPALIKRANVELGIDPAGVRAQEPAAEQRRKTLGALGQLVTGIAELRTRGMGLATASASARSLTSRPRGWPYRLPWPLPPSTSRRMRRERPRGRILQGVVARQGRAPGSAGVSSDGKVPGWLWTCEQQLR
jgi:hypothetical protein